MVVTETVVRRDAGQLHTSDALWVTDDSGRRK
jgi:hypothetical protein